MQTGKGRNFTASLSPLAGGQRHVFNDFLHLQKMTEICEAKSRLREGSANVIDRQDQISIPCTCMQVENGATVACVIRSKGLF